MVGSHERRAFATVSDDSSIRAKNALRSTEKVRIAPPNTLARRLRPSVDGTALVLPDPLVTFDGTERRLAGALFLGREQQVGRAHRAWRGREEAIEEARVELGALGRAHRHAVVAVDVGVVEQV